MFKSIQKEISDKIDENRLVINKSLNNFETDIKRLIEKKANLYDVNALLNSKADSSMVNLGLQSKVSLSDFEKLRNNTERVRQDLEDKLDYKKFQVFLDDNQQLINEVQKELMLKANIKEILHMLKNKADIDDINKALTQIHDELDSKCNLEQVSIF